MRGQATGNWPVYQAAMARKLTSPERLVCTSHTTSSDRPETVSICLDSVEYAVLRCDGQAASTPSRQPNTTSLSPRDPAPAPAPGPTHSTIRKRTRPNSHPDALSPAIIASKFKYLSTFPQIPRDRPPDFTSHPKVRRLKTQSHPLNPPKYISIVTLFPNCHTSLQTCRGEKHPSFLPP